MLAEREAGEHLADCGVTYVDLLQAADGGGALFGAMQERLKGFDNQAVIAAMGCAQRGGDQRVSEIGRERSVRFAQIYFCD